MTEKKIGRHCGFLNAYVAIYVKYDKNTVTARSCEGDGCDNSKCNLSKCFFGNRSVGHDFLDFPKK